jgi:hypothetical protein
MNFMIPPIQVECDASPFLAERLPAADTPHSG